MTRESKYRPLSELADSDNGRIIWNLELPPYAPSEAIGVNIQRLGSLARLGRFKTLSISGYHGDTTQISPAGHSVDTQGNVTASLRSTVSKAKLQKSSIELNNGRLPNTSIMSSHGNVSLNVAELDRLIWEDGQLKDPAAWAKGLDAA